MSKRESKNVLSQEGEARKAAMLGQLQDELVSVHHRRQQRNTIAKGVALAAVVAIASLASSFLVPKSGPENIVAHGAVDPIASPRAPFVSVSNVDGINDKYLVVNSDSSAKLESVSDEELLALLSAAGQPAVLGQIDGKLRVIPDAAPKRKLKASASGSG